MNVAIVPARGGSKRIPRKNVREFCGKPMIAWSITAAIESQCFSRVIVSTDDEQIADVARAAGAEIPFIRPAGLSDDHAATLPVIQHAIEWLVQQGSPPREVCCIYATAPFITAADLRFGLGVLQQSGSDYAFSVTSYPFPPQRAIRITPDQRVQMFDPAQFGVRSQDLEPAYHDAGQFYWGRSDAWLAGKPIFSGVSSPVILPRHRVQDIDTAEDWLHAELMMKVQLNLLR
jgi:N-acylneuraminate cytidylyltransferase